MHDIVNHYETSRGPATALLLGMEACVMVLVVVAPWLLGANDPWAYSLLAWPLGIALLCWATLAIHTGRLAICLCPLGLCLVGLILLTLVQLISLPPDLLQLLSPNASKLRAELIPPAAELLATGEAVSIPVAWQPISLDPGATRVFLTQIMAVTLLYLLVRSNLATENRLMRLGWVLMVNGGALAFFAIAQSITSEKNDIVYWTWITPGAVFGPFVCRNHYPDYINLCVGAVLGVVGWTYHQKLAPRSRDGILRKELFWQPIQEIIASPLELINKPATLLCVFAIALMVGTIPMSMSRGGAVGLIASILLTSIAWLGAGKSKAKRSRKNVPQARNLVLVLWLAIPILGLVAWFGWDVIGKRLGTITDKATLQEDRIKIWTPLFNLVSEYPLTGTGAGTMGVVEPIVRDIGSYPGVVLDHAHNEYLEAMVEGGLPRLVLTGLLVFWMALLGMRGIRRHRGEPSALMPVGLLFGLLALVIHSTVDFGIHMGSVALLATVCMAHLSALARHVSDRPESHDHEETSIWVLQGLPSRLGGAILAVWALLLVNDFATGSTVFRLQMEADQQPVTNSGQERRISLLESAVRLRPWLPELHETIGLAALDMVGSQDSVRRDRIRGLDLAVETGLVHDLLRGPFGFGLVGHLAAENLLDRDQKIDPDLIWSKKYWDLGLAELAQCRSLSPIYRRTHAYMGLYADKFQKSEPASTHLRRAARVYSFDPDLWYSAGLASWLEGDRQQGKGAEDRRDQDQYTAAVLWRESLRRSTSHLADILSRSMGGEKPLKLLELVLPDSPSVLLEAIRLHKPDPRHKDTRADLLQAARQLLEKQGTAALASTWQDLANLQQQLGSPAKAVLGSLRMAVSLAPTDKRAPVSVDLARRLEEIGQIDEAQRYINQALQADPENKLAKELERLLKRDRELAPDLDIPAPLEDR